MVQDEDMFGDPNFLGQRTMPLKAIRTGECLGSLKSFKIHWLVLIDFEECNLEIRLNHIYLVCGNTMCVSTCQVEFVL